MLLVDRDIQIKLENIFPHITTPILFDGEKADLLEETYNIKFVSAFDHWLDADECDAQTMCFSSFIENNDPTYLDRENRFISFYRNLFDIGLYSWEENEDFSSLCFNEYENKVDYLKNCLDSIRENKFINICIPNLNSIICGGFDLTQRILVKKEKDFSDLDKIIKKNSLYTLVK